MECMYNTNDIKGLYVCVFKHLLKCWVGHYLFNGTSLEEANSCSQILKSLLFNQANVSVQLQCHEQTVQSEYTEDTL